MEPILNFMFLYYISHLINGQNSAILELHLFFFLQQIMVGFKINSLVY